MTPSPDFDRRFTAWLEDGQPARAPDHVLPEALALTARTRPRPAWRIPRNGGIPMRVSMALAVIPRAVLIVLTLILATALAAAGYVATQPSPSPLPLLPLNGPAGNGLIAYDAAADIWVMEPDGSNRRNLTADGRYDLEPTWSPDGRWIAFWSHPATDGRLSSNDGSTITGLGSLVIIDAGGGNRRDLATDLDFVYDQMPPSWSPDSTRLVFEHGDAGRPVMDIVSLDDSPPARLGDGRTPSWAPDGWRIAYRGMPDRHEGVFSVLADGSGVRSVSREATGSGFAFTSPQWSADSRFITYQAGPDGAHDVWVARADKIDERMVGSEPEEEYWPSFGPVGDRVAYGLNVDPAGLAYNLVVSDADGANTIVLESPPLWPALPALRSPDGRFLLGIGGVPGGPITLFQIDVTGQAAPNEITTETDWANVSWQRIAR